jgi:outer membrane lipoprotein SlyB
VILLPLIFTSCAHPSSSTYDAADVGRPIETSEASIISSRVVEISGETNVVGPAAGGIGAAATTGVFVNGSNGANALALLAGLVGAGAGYITQQKLNDREGIEYMLKMDDGRTVTLVQNRGEDEEPLADGTPVLIQINGRYTRILADPRAVTEEGGTWVDPDKRAAETGDAADEKTAVAAGEASAQQ